MGPLTADRVREALRAVLFPGFRRDIVTLGMVTDVRLDGGSVQVALRPGTDDRQKLAQLAGEIERVLKKEPGVTAVHVHAAGAAEGRGRNPAAQRAPLPGVRHIIAVSSAKGGVGKSTVAANLAVAMAPLVRGVGLVDADVYGPSVPIMFGVEARHEVAPDKRMRPIERHGVKLVSMGFLLDERAPVIWRGPRVMGIVRHFLHEVDWGATEILIVDLPPGTGDAPLTLVQQVPVTGGVVVTTPQDVALLDVGRGIAMFAQVSTPVLGVVENMAGYVCPSCGTEDALFGSDGGRALGLRFDVPLLARIPIVPAVRQAGDRGAPIVIAEPEHPVSLTFKALAARVVEEAAQASAPASDAGG